MIAAVTTSTNASASLRERANAVSRACGVPFLQRSGSLAAMLREHAPLYVVRADREEIRSGTNAIHVHPALTLTRGHDGLSHPLIRAMGGRGPHRRVADATLGLCQDALHLATVLESEVLGCELSPAVFSLCEEGLARMSRPESPVTAAARRITPVAGDAQHILSGFPDDYFDGVLISPMFTAPERAPPGYPAFRDAAVHGAASPDLIREGLRVSPRVVVKLERRSDVPESLMEFRHSRIFGRALTYVVLTRRDSD